MIGYLVSITESNVQLSLLHSRPLNSTANWQINKSSSRQWFNTKTAETKNPENKKKNKQFPFQKNESFRQHKAASNSTSNII